MVNDTIPVQEQSSLKIFPDPPYGIACCFACDRSSLRSMADTLSVVTPCIRHLAGGKRRGATHGPRAKQKSDGGFGYSTSKY